MWEGRKLLIAAFIFTALSCKVTSVKPLDMAPDGVDGPYVGCRKEAMEKIIHSGLLRQELNASEGFQKAWSANVQCPKLIPGGTKEHTAALLTYANGDEDFKKNFNDAVKTFGGNASTYENHFHFKSLHFLLMDSMFLQNPNKCQTVYILQEHYTAKKGLKVTFGKFTEVHSDYNSLKKMEDFDGQVLLNITSCIFVNLGVDICRKEQDMTLISPTEVFTVEEVKNIYDDINDSRYTEFILKHSEQDRMQHCYFFSRSPADVSPQWLVFVLVASSLITFHY
ncbi:ecto-ADP-ribosyltransferase 5 isoform X2 [Plectropomus leopardus]|nr:ecto-ADP-ribosyltransferase 5 isoform X2 [Plectropomus leopardus]XP_042341366.1 ecto-ADP-ribosyltransferase 5 isoform X2 [Plectropomus leopardus]